MYSGSRERRSPALYQLAAAALVAAVLAFLPASAASAGPRIVGGPEETTRCQAVTVPVTEVGDAAGAIAATLCVPPGATTVQVLVPGNTYNRSYWQADVDPATYSYMRRANLAGYATLAIDRLGTGGSLRPPSTAMTFGNDVATGDRRLRRVPGPQHQQSDRYTRAHRQRRRRRGRVRRRFRGLRHQPTPAGIGAAVVRAARDRHGAGRTGRRSRRHAVTMHRSAAAVKAAITAWIEDTIGHGVAMRGSTPARIAAPSTAKTSSPDPAALAANEALLATTPLAVDTYSSAPKPVPGQGDGTNPFPVYNELLRTIANLPAPCSGRGEKDVRPCG